MAKLKVAELELLFTADTDQVQKAENQVVATAKKIEKNPVKLDADTKGALAGMDRVEAAAKKLVSKDTALKLDADISRAEKSLDRTKQRLEDLQVRALGGLDVTADVKRAEAQLSRTQRTLDGLVKARNVIDVQADTSDAEAALDDVSDVAGDAGEDSGQKFGERIIDALGTIPVAGAVIGIGAAAAAALVASFNKGLQIEVGYDRLQALTGIDEAAARRLGNAAGEAYANNFGASIESNMDTTRLALQFRILDPKATTRDAQLVVQGLAGIADVLEEDVRPVAQAVTQMLSTGMAKNAEHAYDIIAAGARNGLNRNEDLLDTLTEYPALFQRLGLSGDEALGLINQGMKAGARNSDLAADALKEFQIRATDASETSAEGFRALGLNADEMTAKIARGGKDARDGLAVVLDKLRETEDPVLRNASAVALFGTQAEDLGEALFAMDLSSAVAELDGVTGSAKRMFDTLASNDASKIEQAKRNIEVAANGIQAALATAFSEPLGDFADWVSQNRGPMLQFFSDLINGAIDFAQTANTGFGEFVSGPLAAMVEGLARVIGILNYDAGKELADFSEEMRGFGDSTEVVNDKLEDMRGQFNGFADAQIALGYVNDASLRTADAISKVGVNADGTAASLAGVDSANLSASASGRRLEDQLMSAVSAFDEEISKAREAGESQTNLTDRYNTTRQALIDQMVAMGMSEDAAQSLIDTVLKTPKTAKTEYTSNADAEKSKADRLAQRIVTLPDGSVAIRTNTSAAQNQIDGFIRKNDGRVIRVKVAADGTSVRVGAYTVSPQADGGVVMPMAAGGTLSPMAPIAQAVPPNTWRVVGDRIKDREFYIPDDGSARSMSVLLEAMKSFGVMPMAAGGVAEPGPMRRQSTFGPGTRLVLMVGDREFDAYLEESAVRVVQASKMSRQAARSRYGN